MKRWPQDRNGNYFMTGCRVKDIYSDKYGTLEGYSAQFCYPRLLVLFDGEQEPVAKMAAMVEVVSGGLKPGN